MDSQELQRIKNKYDIIGNDASLGRAIETALAVAPTDLAVLITGESGVGKDVFPKMIHQHSARRMGKFLAVNCGAIPSGTINSELFGHEKGAFTGAVAARKGYFEEADGGTLFLDEIGELPKDTQAMLLRVLQNGEYMKVGSSVVEKTDVRVIVATNINLLHAVSQGRFREDLYYRLNSVTISIPSLRERADDIYLLFRKFSSDFAEKNRMCKISLSHEAISLLKSYRWPGNVRQLKNVTESITALESFRVAPGMERCEIDAMTLSAYIPKEKGEVLPAILQGSSSGMSDDDRQMIIKAILDLKREVDHLKEKVSGLKDNPVPQVSAPTDFDGSPAGRAFGHNAPEDGFPDRTEEPEEAEWQESAEVPHKEESLSLADAERTNILKALEKHGGNRKLAAEELGISERTLYRRLSSETK